MTPPLSHSHLCIGPNLRSVSSPHTERSRRLHLSQFLNRNLDRVNVLGQDLTTGHSGQVCVNTLSWARDGELLLTGGDDTTVRIWGLDAANVSQEYPFVCRAVIQTGHRANIFNAQMLPHSSRITTVAGDREVRVFDIEEPRSVTINQRETIYGSRQACTNILRCHKGRVKRIVTEHSPDLFLTVAEDGSVRQHDLRVSHNCGGRVCPPPLVKIKHSLSTLALSPLTPYQFVVAGESPYGYLFDRRHVGRSLQEEWGMIPQDSDDLTTCVRRFGRPQNTRNPRHARSEHITGARMSAYNGHELLLSYSADGVYLYSTADDPASDSTTMTPTSPILPSNTKHRNFGESDAIKTSFEPDVSNQTDVVELAASPSVNHRYPEHLNRAQSTDGHDTTTDEDDEDEYIEFMDAGPDEADLQPHVPVIMPRRRFDGARNVETVKDVNFLGPINEFITSGSDDGNFFIWHKATGALHGIYEGDSSVVNMVEGHPHLPLIAVSGIDTTVKLFASTKGSSKFSRIDNAEQIIDTNMRLSSIQPLRYNLATLLTHARLAMGASEEGIPECRTQ
ncbi:WD40-repeat-containing domain protein [Collybia nuda]|uniref:WD40-repeat-containing domain protein n=1 Tax=Collybia nuda TaxID=64659 RepID=A0A9P5XUL6_9AGAR|nr:WD40-repeat-containing domain protein [Collybia nuda]